MLTRNDVLSRAADECMKELYSLAQPSVKWEDFEKQNKEYTDNYEKWVKYNKAYCDRTTFPEKWEEMKSKFPEKWEGASVTECIGPKPYEFYYLPKEVLADVFESYKYAYRITSQEDLIDVIKTLKNYCNDPIIDKYIQPNTDNFGNYHPGHRSYERPDDLLTEINKILIKYNSSIDSEQELVNKFFEFLDMAGNFFNWNRELNSFSMSIYLGPSPNSNKEAVIQNWKKYRNKNIEIDESKYEEDNNV